MKRITVWSDGADWQATFHDDEEVKRLFGTDTLPTAFTAQADGYRVQREVQRLNPDCEVVLAIAITPHLDSAHPFGGINPD